VKVAKRSRLRLNLLLRVARKLSRSKNLSKKRNRRSRTSLLKLIPKKSPLPLSKKNSKKSPRLRQMVLMPS